MQLWGLLLVLDMVCILYIHAALTSQWNNHYRNWSWCTHTISYYPSTTHSCLSKFNRMPWPIHQSPLQNVGAFEVPNAGGFNQDDIPFAKHHQRDTRMNDAWTGSVYRRPGQPAWNWYKRTIRQRFHTHSYMFISGVRSEVSDERNSLLRGYIMPAIPLDQCGTANRDHHL